MRSNFKVGKTIAGFAFTVGRHDASQSRLLIDTFSKTKERAEEKLKRSKKFFFSKGDGVYRMYSIHMTVMRELEFNLDEGLPVLEDDEEEFIPEIKMVNGRLVLEDAFDLKNPITTTRRRNA